MFRQIRLACLFGLAVLLCGTTFAQFITFTVERIINDEIMRSFEKKARLTELGEEAVPTLLSYLDAHPESWRLIVSVLGDIGDQRATEPLLRRLDAEPTELRAVILALEKLKDPRAVEPLLQLIGKVRGEEAITALGNIGDPRAEAAILVVLNSKDESVENRIRAATALLEIASVDIQGEASDLLLRDEYLHQLHEQQKPESHPYWRFPHDAWWRALRTVGTDEAYATLARWLRKPLMLYYQGALMKIVGEISGPPAELIESLYWSAAHNYPGEPYYSAMALQVLTGYGPIANKDRLLGEIQMQLATLEKILDISTAPSQLKLLTNLKRMEAEVESWD